MRVTPDDDDVDECPMCEGTGETMDEGHDDELIPRDCEACCGAGMITYWQAKRLRAAMRAEAMD